MKEIKLKGNVGICPHCDKAFIVKRKKKKVEKEKNVFERLGDIL